MHIQRNYKAVIVDCMWVPYYCIRHQQVAVLTYKRDRRLTLHACMYVHVLATHTHQGLQRVYVATAVVFSHQVVRYVAINRLGWHCRA